MIEQNLCKTLTTLFKDLLPTIEIEGNWLEKDFAGLEEYHAALMTINISPRAYESYTSHVCEFKVTLEGEFALEEDVRRENAMRAYTVIIDRLEEWHANINAVKRDLTCEGFMPVGLRLDGGEWMIDRETKKRIYVQQFTVKGRKEQTK